jgi:hypothetical protein
MKHFLMAVMVFFFLPSLFIASVQAENGQARLQVIHNAADPAAASVDIYVNDALLLEGFGFREATPFIDVPAETELTIGVAPAGGETYVGTFDVVLSDGGTYILIANGVLDPSGFSVNPDAIDIAFTLFVKADARESSTESAEVQFIVVHGATDAPAVDVSARGVATLVNNASYGAITDYIGVPAGAYVIDILPAGGSVPVASFDLDVSGLAGGSAVILASGFLNPAGAGEPFSLITVLADGTVLSLVTSVDGMYRSVPESYNLYQNYPNPFNPTTTIQFALPSESIVTMEIFNVLGKKVTTLISNERLGSGSYNIAWNGRDEGGQSVASGMYIYRLNAGDYVASKSMLMLK